MYIMTRVLSRAVSCVIMCRAAVGRGGVVWCVQDLLRPFLLACNHADASPHLMIMAMGSIQYLINRDAILPSDAPNILR